MELADTYRLSEYQDLEYLDERKRIRLVRNRIDGRICVIRTVPIRQKAVYERLARLHHAHIPEIYALFADAQAEEVTVVMEYIDGSTIEERLGEGVFPADRALGIIAALCEALTLLHEADPPVICRDLKAENIMIDTAGRVVIVDFDIARIYREGMTRDTQLLGTHEYAAPEQFGYAQTDARTDIYALGVLLNYMVLGKFPSEETAGGRIGEIVEKCTRLDPAQRYQSARELAAALPQPDGAAEGLCGGAASSSSAGTGAMSSSPPAAGFLPPGFRSGRLRSRVIAVCGYVLITWFCFSLELTDETGEILAPLLLHLEQACLWLSQIAWILLVFDYRGIRGSIPLCRSRSRPVRLIGYVLGWCVLVLLAVIAMVLLEDLFF